MASGRFRPLCIPSNSARDAEMVHAGRETSVLPGEGKQNQNTAWAEFYSESLLHAENNRFLQSTGNSLLPFLFPSPDCVINGRYHVNRNTETAGQNKETNGGWGTHKDLGSNRMSCLISEFLKIAQHISQISFGRKRRLGIEEKHKSFSFTAN